MGLFNSILKAFVGDKAKKDLRLILPIVDEIKKIGNDFEKLTNDELRQLTTHFKEKITSKKEEFDKEIEKIRLDISNSQDIVKTQNLYTRIDELEMLAIEKTNEVLDEILPKAFAVVKETCRRFYNSSQIEVSTTEYDRFLSQEKNYVKISNDKTIWSNEWDAAGKPIKWDMVHYDVQLIGGIALHQGKISEMQTGEGKTLAATLPIYLNALVGKGVHLVTVNDYLAKRDSAWMGPIFEFHGLSVDCIDKHKPNSVERKSAYKADITYGTNNEFGFDYLRDNMTHTPDDLVQRVHNFAIVDEVDSVLIDDARTPLIISGPVPEGERHEFDQLKPKVYNLFMFQRKMLSNVLAEAKKKISDGDNQEGGKLLYRVFRGLPKNKALIKYLSEEGIKQLLQKTENFYMQDNNREMHIIDSELYFVIDEKNNSVELTEKGLVNLSESIEDKNFFILPDIGTEVAKIESQDLKPEDEAEKKNILYSKKILSM